MFNRVMLYRGSTVVTNISNIKKRNSHNNVFRKHKLKKYNFYHKNHGFQQRNLRKQIDLTNKMCREQCLAVSDDYTTTTVQS